MGAVEQASDDTAKKMHKWRKDGAACLAAIMKCGIGYRYIYLKMLRTAKRLNVPKKGADEAKRNRR